MPLRISKKCVICICTENIVDRNIDQNNNANESGKYEIRKLLRARIIINIQYSMYAPACIYLSMYNICPFFFSPSALLFLYLYLYPSSLLLFHSLAIPSPLSLYQSLFITRSHSLLFCHDKFDNTFHSHTHTNALTIVLSCMYHTD